MGATAKGMNIFCGFEVRRETNRNFQSVCVCVVDDILRHCGLHTRAIICFWLIRKRVFVNEPNKKILHWHTHQPSHHSQCHHHRRHSSPTCTHTHTHTSVSLVISANNGQRTHQIQTQIYVCAVRVGKETCSLITEEFPILIFAVTAVSLWPRVHSFHCIIYFVFTIRISFRFRRFSACFFLACGKVNNCNAIRICQHFLWIPFLCDSSSYQIKRQIKRLLSHSQMRLVATRKEGKMKELSGNENRVWCSFELFPFILLFFIRFNQQLR